MYVYIVHNVDTVHIDCGLLGALPNSLNLVAYVISILSSDKIRSVEP